MSSSIVLIFIFQLDIQKIEPGRFLDFSEMEFEVGGPSPGSVFVLGFKQKFKRNHLLNPFLEMLKNALLKGWI